MKVRWLLTVVWIWRRRRRRRVKLGLCASLLAPSSTAGWVGCSEEIADAYARCNFIIQRLNQSAMSALIFGCLTTWYIRAELLVSGHYWIWWFLMSINGFLCHLKIIFINIQLLVSSGQLLIPFEYLEVPLPGACFLVRGALWKKSAPLKAPRRFNKKNAPSSKKSSIYAEIHSQIKDSQFIQNHKKFESPIKNSQSNNKFTANSEIQSPIKHSQSNQKFILLKTSSQASKLF